MDKPDTIGDPADRDQEWASALLPTVRYCAALAASVSLVEAAQADHARFHIEKNILFYNTYIPRDGSDSDEIAYEDAEDLALYVMDYPQLDTIVLGSKGGNSWAALRMAETVSRFELKTEVWNGCYSACPLIFLAGSQRLLARGGSLGFHRSITYVSDIGYFASFMNTKPPEMTLNEIVYDLGVSASVEVYTFMLAEGVHPDFILEVMATPPREMLYPNRQDLIDAGIINE